MSSPVLLSDTAVLLIVAELLWDSWVQWVGEKALSQLQCSQKNEWAGHVHTRIPHNQSLDLFTKPVQGRDVAPFFHLAVLYKRFNTKVYNSVRTELNEKIDTTLISVR